MSYCLHQISEMSGISNLIANAVRAAAYMVEEMGEHAVNEIVRDAVLSQTNELAQDLRSLIEDAKEKIGDHIQTRLNELTPPSPLSSSAYPTQSQHHAETISPENLCRGLIQPTLARKPKIGGKREHSRQADHARRNRP
jgi:hypothetical protein